MQHIQISVPPNNNGWGQRVNCDLFSLGLNYFFPQLVKMNLSLPAALCFALLTSLLRSSSLILLLCAQQSSSSSISVLKARIDPRKQIEDWYFLFFFPAPPPHQHPDAAPSAHCGTIIKLNSVCNNLIDRFMVPKKILLPSVKLAR